MNTTIKPTQISQTPTISIDTKSMVEHGDSPTAIILAIAILTLCLVAGIKK